MLFRNLDGVLCVDYFGDLNITNGKSHTDMSA
jgi:hypothetical protein